MLYTLHGINFIRQRVFDGSKDTTEGFYTEAEIKKKKKKDILGFLVMFSHPFVSKS